MSKQEKHDARRLLKMFKRHLELNAKMRALGCRQYADPARLPK